MSQSVRTKLWPEILRENVSFEVGNAIAQLFLLDVLEHMISSARIVNVEYKFLSCLDMGLWRPEKQLCVSRLHNW